VIDYEMYARIRDCRDRQGLTITQIASTLGLHRETVAKWLARSRFERPRPPKRSSLLDPVRGRITRLLDTHPYSGQQIFQRLREEGYCGRRYKARQRRTWPTCIPNVCDSIECTWMAASFGLMVLGCASLR
jgi:transposase